MNVATQRLAAVAIAFLVLGPAPAIADYESCMKFCVAEHSFSHCNTVCSGGEKKAEGDEKKDSGPKIVRKAESCSDEDDIIGEVLDMLNEGFANLSLVTYDMPDNLANGIEIDFFPGNYSCAGMVKISPGCDLTIEYQCEEAD